MPPFPAPPSSGSLDRVAKGLSLVIVGTRLSYFLFGFAASSARDELFNIFFLPGARDELLDILFPDPSSVPVSSGPSGSVS